MIRRHLLKGIVDAHLANLMWKDLSEWWDDWLMSGGLSRGRDSNSHTILLYSVELPPFLQQQLLPCQSYLSEPEMVIQNLGSLKPEWKLVRFLVTEKPAKLHIWSDVIPINRRLSFIVLGVVKFTIDSIYVRNVEIVRYLWSRTPDYKFGEAKMWLFIFSRLIVSFVAFNLSETITFPCDVQTYLM